MPRNIKRILRELKKGLIEIYGEQLKAVILFGSYARGDAHPPDSDIDVLIVLQGEFDYWEVSKRSSELVASLSLENEVVIFPPISLLKEYINNKKSLFFYLL